MHNFFMHNKLGNLKMSSLKGQNAESESSRVRREKNSDDSELESYSDSEAWRDGREIGAEQFGVNRGDRQGEYRELYSGKDRSFGGILGQLIALSEARIAKHGEQLAEEKAYLELLKHFKETVETQNK
jgi:hypothetical protein